MMDSLLFEAKLIGFKEGFKIGLVWLVFSSYLFTNDRKKLIRPFYAGLFISVLFGISVLFIPKNVISGAFIGNTISMSFALFLIISGAALYHVSGVNLLPGKSEAGSESVTRLIVFISAIIFFLPDIAGTVVYLDDLAMLKENALMTSVSTVAGLLIAGVIFFAIIKLYKPFRLGSFFALPQLLLFLAMVKLFGSGIRGIAELSLVPSVQRGFMKFIHDFVHQTFVMLMVPDHPLLKKTTWDFIAIFFGSGFASLASLFILLTVPAIFIYHSLFKPLPEPGEESRVSRRMIKSIILSDRRKKALPVILFVIFIMVAWFSQGEESVSKLFMPESRPVIADKGVVEIPLNDPTMNLMDGRLHKFSLIHKGEEIRLIVIKKADNSLSVCLDACEICPPVGYGQRDDHVVCIYCMTPIPVDTLGDPGGCNPIPLTTVIDARFIKIEMKEILKKWDFVKLKK
jgi:high-affinity iron transporter